MGRIGFGQCGCPWARRSEGAGGNAWRSRGVCGRVGLLVAAATLTVASFGFASSASAALSFGRTDFPLPEGTWTGGGGTAPRSDVLTSAALGDLNNDGKLDILVANGYTGNVVVLLNQGDGAFAPAQ